MEQLELVEQIDAIDHRRRATGQLIGEMQFASPEAQAQRTNELRGAGAMIVSMPTITSAIRGALAELIDERIEHELALQGAPGPSAFALYGNFSGVEDTEARLSDQLFRARTIGASGIALALGSLSAIAEPTMTPEDSATLRYLARACQEAPLAMLIDDGDVMTPAYAPPVPLVSLLAVEPVLEHTTNESVVAPVRDHDLVAAREPEPIPAIPTKPIAQPEPLALPPELPADDVTRAEAPDGSEGEENVEEHEPTLVPPPIAPAEAEVQAQAEAEVQVQARRGDGWRTWAIALDAARGPQALATFERLFAESYVPLANELALGLDDNRALRAHGEFRRSFERSYTDAFPTFGATGKRPKLVMDAHDVASKNARLANARAAHVLIVDSLSYDLGQKVKSATAARCAGVATLTGEQILWSALPSTTMRQLETIARGMDALRSPATEEPSESLRGRTAEVVRRLRVGSREVAKLDLVPALLTQIPEESAERVLSAFDDVADAVAESLARHFASLPPRTLVLVVGDHGFTIDGRGRLLHGGASPEEILVPAHAWLTGDLH